MSAGTIISLAHDVSWLAVVGSRLGIEARNWSNRVSMKRQPSQDLVYGQIT